jgi:uncharacterized repeat protein (TIGR01451 family)
MRRHSRREASWHRAGSGSSRVRVISGTVLATCFFILLSAGIAPAADASSVSGTVTAQGSPVSGATVEALDVSTAAVLDSTSTAANGSYNLSVAANLVDVRVTPPPASGLQVSTVTNVDTSSPALLDIILVAGTVQVSGVVRDSDGDPVQNAIVQISDGGYSYVYTGADGSYSFTVAPGNYSVYVYGDNLPGLPNHWSFYKPGILVNASRTVDIKLPPTVSVTFRVQDPDSNPVAGAQVVGINANHNGADLGPDFAGAQGSTYTNGEALTTDAGGVAHFLAFQPVSGISATAVPNQPGLTNAGVNINPYVAGTTVAIVFPATDHAAPQANLVSPPDNVSYFLGQSVAADYTCQDEPGGSGMSRCEGTVANGQPIDTSTVGTFAFTVLAVDHAGNSSTVTHHYSVVVGDHDVAITKTASPGNPRPGDTVTYSLKARNLSSATAEDVVITDSLPAGVTFTSADAPCTENAGTVTCEIGSLAPGEEKTFEVKAKVDSWGTADPTADHLLDVQKVEVQVDLEAGQKRILTAACPSGYFVVDGSLRIDHIDQGAGDWTAPQVTQSWARTAETWRVALTNTATGRAQAKLFAVCVRYQTNDEDGHRHDLVISDQIDVSDTPFIGLHEATLQCGPGQVAIEPGFQTSGPADLVYSQPAGNGWKFVLDVKSNAEAAFTIRCMNRQVSVADGHTHDLKLERISTEVEIGPGKVNEAQLTCADGSKGIVAGWDLDYGLVSLGNDPRPVTRAFKLYNPTNAPLHARLSLLCLGDRTAGENDGPRDITNTASISTSSSESSTANNISSATVTAEDTDNFISVPNPPAVKPTPNNPIATTRIGGSAFVKKSGVNATITCTGACSGSGKLVSLGKVKIKGKKIAKGTVLALGHYKLNAAGTKKIRLKIRGRKARQILKKSNHALIKLSGGTKSKVRVQGR